MHHSPKRAPPSRKPSAHRKWARARWPNKLRPLVGNVGVSKRVKSGNKTVTFNTITRDAGKSFCACRSFYTKASATPRDTHCAAAAARRWPPTNTTLHGRRQSPPTSSTISRRRCVSGRAPEVTRAGALNFGRLSLARTGGAAASAHWPQPDAAHSFIAPRRAQPSPVRVAPASGNKN